MNDTIAENMEAYLYAHDSDSFLERLIKWIYINDKTQNFLYLDYYE